MKNTTIGLRILYPLWALVGIFSLLIVPSKLIDWNNDVLTVKQIIDNETLFRAGIAGSLITQILFIVIALLLAKLFKETSTSAVKWLLALSLTAVPIAMLNEINHFAALFSLDNSRQVIFFLKLHQQGVTIASIFWGLWLFPLGFLIYQSQLFPKWVGVVVIIAGVGYCCASWLKIMGMKNFILLPFFEILTVGEIIWMLWLTVLGVKKITYKS